MIKQASNTKYKVLQVVVKAKQSDAVPSSCDGAGYSVCLSYDVGNIYFVLAQTQQHFSTIVQLAHACPTMSCIHLAESLPMVSIAIVLMDLRALSHSIH